MVDEAELEGIVLEKEKGLKWDVPTGLLAMLWGGTLFVYSTLFAIGSFLYDNLLNALILGILALAALLLLRKTWTKLRLD